MHWLTIFILALGTGCAWTDSSHTKHTLILGFGIVSVNQSHPELATVVRYYGAGAVIASTPGIKAGIGLFRNTSICVESTNLLIEVEKRANGTIHVFVPPL